MKKVIGILTLLIAVIGFTAAADAAIVTFTDSVDMGITCPMGLHMDSNNSCGVSSKSWQFDITGDGFVPGEYDVTSATMNLHFSEYDNDDDRVIRIFRWKKLIPGKPEYADLTAGTDYFAEWEVDTGTKAFSVSTLTSLQANGTLSCTLNATGGNFWFNKAELSVDAQPVPEPATMLMFGAGLLGLFFRKKI